LTRIYRLTRRVFAANPFDGEGSYRFGGRWSNPGTRLVYMSEHLSLAMLEYLAHLDPNDLPNDLVLAQAEIPDSLDRLIVQPNELPKRWHEYPAPEELANIGDKFAAYSSSAILIVPSVLAANEYNWLLNPNHPDFQKIRILPNEPFQYDRRLTL
jgi:RES domain-containing protein